MTSSLRAHRAHTQHSHSCIRSTSLLLPSFLTSLPTMELFVPKPRMAICSLAVVVSLLTLVAVTRGYRDNIHPQPHQHHQPILSGALFPTERPEAKQPCPKECIQHGSGLYLAVTSIGYGFPRVQFTCTGPHHPQATDHKGQGGKGENPLPCSPRQVHTPADPTPEFAPTPPSHRNDQQVRAHAGNDIDRSTSYTDMHITAGKGQQHSTIKKQSDPSEHERQHATTTMDYEGLGFTGNAAEYQPHYGFVFSPRERAWESFAQTTTFTYGMGHHQKEAQEQRQVDIQASSVTPEAVVSFPAPTPMADEGHKNHQKKVHESEAECVSKNTVEPPAPTPEPLAGQPVTGVDKRTRDMGEKNLTPAPAEKDKREGEPKRAKVYRVTTLIIETETIIAPPRPTHGASWWMMGKKQDHDPHPGDHVMFDAGMEGDIVVSMVSSGHEQEKQRQRQKQQQRLH